MIQTLLLLGAGQGLFLAIILAFRRTNSVANRILAALMLAFSAYIFQDVYYERGYYNAFPHFIGVSQPLIFAFGPLIYLYAKAVADGGRSFTWRSLAHLIPAAVVFAILSPFYVLDGSSKVAFLQQVMRGNAPTYLAVIQNLQYPYGVLYVVLTILLLRHHRSRSRWSSTRSAISAGCNPKSSTPTCPPNRRNCRPRRPSRRKLRSTRSLA